MEKDTFLSEVKEFAKTFISKHLTKEKFMDAKLADGTLISINEDELETGVIAYLIDTTGQRLVMPKGSYTLEDGTTFDVVDDLGTVDNVVKAEMKDGEEMPMPATPAMPEEQAASPAAQPKAIVESTVRETRFSKEEIDLEFAVYEEKFNKAIEKVEAEKVELMKQVESNNAMVKEMFELIKKIAEYEGKKPEVAPTETRKNVFNVKEFRQEFKKDLEKYLK